MKKQVVNVLTRFGLLSVIALVTVGGSAQAQSLAYKLRANIPFDFVVGDKTLRAGKYTVGRTGSDAGDNILLITGIDSGSNAVRSSIPIESRVVKDKGRLVFHRYGDQYFLVQVWPAATSTGRVLLKSRSEREIERKLANHTAMPAMMSGKVQAEMVTVVVDLQ